MTESASLFKILGEALEDGPKSAARLSCSDHVIRKGTKNVPILTQCTREVIAALHAFQECFYYALEALVSLIAAYQAERTVQREPGD